jgi:hypothetical protein
VGMVPMALALERGSQMQAPLGLAVIGGLVMSTFATLLVLPSIFAVVIGDKVYASPSIYPDDPESAYYDPLVYSEMHESDHGAGHEAAPPASQPSPAQPSAAAPSNVTTDVPLNLSDAPRTDGRNPDGTSPGGT